MDYYTEGSTTPTAAPPPSDQSPSPSPSTNTNTNTSPYSGDPRLSHLESEVLNEYARLRSNLDVLAQHLASLSSSPSSAVADGLRLLERKTSLVCTALKASVYGILLQQQIEYAGEDGEEEGR